MRYKLFLNVAFHANPIFLAMELAEWTQPEELVHAQGVRAAS